ncbi:MAG: hypothetical protein ABH829_01510 [archaeon]
MADARLVVFDFGSGQRLEELSRLAEDKQKFIISFDMTRDTDFCPRSKLLIDYKRSQNLDVYKLKDNFFFVHHDVTQIPDIPWRADYVVTRPLKTNNGAFPSNMLRHLKHDCAVFIRTEFTGSEKTSEYPNYVGAVKTQLAQHGFKFLAKGDSLVAIRGDIRG